ncbi:Polysaccharide chain length determinant protein (PEP-CTERM system associated) [Alteromonas macleodii]|uniref:XrtA system polysaccharide chain length determinant n=1 Tax=Alteromonas sp. BZK5 TaxID=1904459 RepID=UPI001653E11B|nr:XrtA system polysaccharide chain length determinant [Alteromonas sp. BZK5]MBC6985318.1 chain-length determining protein [Alteromonas sp. BZK5]|tara:strand:- start:3022 stop:4581 length:1560 start_codon:yes stop_codon:yes gene_type:complete
MQELQSLLILASDYLKGIWIKKRYVIICSWLICPAGFLYVANQSDYYSSNATVHVDTRSMLQPLLRGLAIQTNKEQEIRLMAKTFFTPENVAKIVRNSDLDLTTKTDAQFDSLVNRLKNQINLNSTSRDNIYRVSYSNKDPVVAQRVVQETLNLFVEGALGDNRRNSDNAERFIDNEIAEYENRLMESEQRLADFKRNYSDILPVQGSFYSRLENEKNRLSAVELEIRQTKKQLEAFAKQLANAKTQLSNGSTENSGLTTRYDSRIRSLEQKLDELSLRFTEQHPDVIETKLLIEALEARRSEEIEVLIKNSGEEPVQLNSLSRDLSLEMSRLESQLASQTVQRDDIASRILELQSKIDLVPQIEAESTALNRDYGILKSKYNALLTRKESAELAKRAELSGEDIQFKILQPPNLPGKPAGPKRILQHVLVLFAGFGAGLGLAFLVSQFSPVLFRSSQLKTITDYPVLGVVGHLEITKVKRRNRFRIFVFAISTGVILLMFAAVIAIDITNKTILQGLF